MDSSLDEAPPVQLSVVIDGRLDGGRARQVATLASRLGLAGVWLRLPWWPLAGPGGPVPALDADLLPALGSCAGTRPGLVVDADAADPDEAGPDEAGAGWLSRLVAVPAGLRIALTGTPAAVAGWQEVIGRRLDLAVSQLVLPPGAGSGSGTGPLAVFVPCAPGRDLAAGVSAAVTAAAGRPVLAEVTVSVGRTAAEARARADADELFALVGHPAQQGLFGTLEECQATAALLGHAGVTELVCYLPLASDLPDVLAQVRSIAIGAGVLRPGEPPSAAPPPPPGWGGRRITA
jgi:hypothetical protein